MRVSSKTIVLLRTISLSYRVVSSPIANPLSIRPSTALDNEPVVSPPSATKPEYITIFTDADVTWCRPWPNTAIHPQNSVNFYKGTPLNLTCWTPNDIPGTEAGISDPLDIWVKTEGNGCYINENDLRGAELNFEDVLGLCGAPGPHKLAGNRPDSTTPRPPALPFPPPSPLPPASPLPQAAPNPPASPLPPATPEVLPLPVAQPTPSVEVPKYANGSQPLVSPKNAPEPLKSTNGTKISSMRRRAKISRPLY